LKKQFQTDGEINWNALAQLPTLFIQEGKEDEVARVGRILRARQSGRDIVVEYVYEPTIPPLLNQRLVELAPALDIDGFEFSRTHWAVKEVDLFKALVSSLEPRRQRPRVFRLDDPERIEPSLVAAMMPFSRDLSRVDEAIREAADAVGLRCRRADDIWENPEVMQDVVSLIDRAKIVVCDCTGRNPNVFYEIGIAHTLGREVILITQSENDIPFDLRHLRYIKYLNNGEGVAELKDRLTQRFSDLAG